MSAAEFVLWEADYARNPWGEYRGDVHAAIVASTVANVNRGKRRPFTISQFMPKFAEAGSEGHDPGLDELASFSGDTKHG